MNKRSLSLPLIPILRGIRTHEAVAVAQALVGEGYDCVEVPLNSPAAFDTLALLRERFPDLLLGAGTVLSIEEVDALAALGTDLCLSPHFNAAVVTRILHHGMQAMPGVATPSECFAAIDAGARQLKAFPAEMITPPVLKAWRAVLPGDISLFPVGGIRAENMASYLHAGASGFGFGASVYAPGDSADNVAAKAAHIRRTWAHCHGRHQA